jgi:hypothetical protein
VVSKERSGDIYLAVQVPCPPINWAYHFPWSLKRTLDKMGLDEALREFISWKGKEYPIKSRMWLEGAVSRSLGNLGSSASGSSFFCLDFYM